MVLTFGGEGRGLRGGRMIRTSIMQRQRPTGGNIAGKRNGGCTGLTCYGNWQKV